jgi:NAD(P)-dependent dehydrogenase (short-subunit alcohol dehydrogenase family)
MIDHAGKNILITGGASGIGEALAEALAARGANIIVADVQAEAAAAVADRIGGQAIICDLSESGAPERLVADAYGLAGRLDFIAANAGFGRRKKVLKEDFGPDTERLFAVNMMAPIRMAQAYAARLAETGARGRLMITGSENSLSVPSAVRRSALGAYAATKHGVLILAEWLREELAGETMDLHVLLPGAVYTGLIAPNLPDPALAPKEIGLIMPERCAEIALQGIDLGLFYIPTHAHIADDMAPRMDGVRGALKALGLLPD